MHILYGFHSGTIVTSFELLKSGLNYIIICPLSPEIMYRLFPNKYEINFRTILKLQGFILQFYQVQMIHVDLSKLIFMS